MTDFDSKIDQIVEWSVEEGLRDEVAIGLIYAFAAALFDPGDRREAVLECVRRVLADDLMSITSSVGGEYIPHEGGVEDRVEMVEINFPYEDDGETYRPEHVFLYWFVNTEKGDEKARSLA